jgi:hypothetical protein
MSAAAIENQDGSEGGGSKISDNLNALVSKPKEAANA